MPPEVMAVGKPGIAVTKLGRKRDLLVGDLERLLLGRLLLLLQLVGATMSGLLVPVLGCCIRPLSCIGLAEGKPRPGHFSSSMMLETVAVVRVGTQVSSSAALTIRRLSSVRGPGDVPDVLVRGSWIWYGSVLKRGYSYEYRRKD